MEKDYFFTLTVALREELVVGVQAGLSPPLVQFLQQEHAAPERMVVAMSFRLLERCGQLLQVEAVRAVAVKTPRTALALR